MVDPHLKEKFLSVLTDGDGNIAQAARGLGVNVNTAYRWARQAGVRGQGRLVRPVNPGRAIYDRLRAQGVPRAQAVVAAGVSMTTARRWERGIKDNGRVRVYPDGRRVQYTSRMTTQASRASRQPSPEELDLDLGPGRLSSVEREQIADLHRAGLSNREIGRKLGRAGTTISRELKAHSNAGRYNPYQAHRAAVTNRQRFKTSKLAQQGLLREYVQDKLNQRWSPEQISHTLIKEFPHDEEMRVSTETIYQAIYVQARGGLKREVTQALRTGRTTRKKHKSPDERRSRFIDEEILIAERPPEVEDRAVPGHWEGDLIMGSFNQSAIITLVERTTRYVMLGYLPRGHTAAEVRVVLEALIQTLPAHLRGSLTWDQGAEMAEHAKFTLTTNVTVYFCDPHSPWQRGTNENTNGLLRQYFPKGTDLSVYSALDLELVAQQLNGRPRKTLDWDPPAKRLQALLETATDHQ